MFMMGRGHENCLEPVGGTKILDKRWGGYENFVHLTGGHEDFSGGLEATKFFTKF